MMDLTRRIIRVFPKRTEATPDDELAFVGEPPLQLPQADEVHVSCTFTWRKREAERLARVWGLHYPVVKIGGPAYDDTGGVFVPGMYVKRGRVFTTRGCPNRCNFCLVPKREGELRCLPIRDGHNVLDNNLLAAPRGHVERVLDMLSRQKRRAVFSGGLEARRLELWFVEAITAIKFKRLFFAYDRPGEWSAVNEAISLVRYYGHRHDKIGCYVLCGFEGDTVDLAEARCRQVKNAGGTPYPMYYQPLGGDGRRPREWRDFIGTAWSRLGAVNDERCSKGN